MIKVNHSRTSDAQLVALLHEGDESAYTEIYNRYWEKLYHTAHKKLQSAPDAEEMVQQIFLVLWMRRQQLKIIHLSVYLSAMLRYAVYKHFAQQQPIFVSTESAIGEPATAAFDLENKFFLRLLENVAKELPENQRIVFLQHKLLDKPLDEIAAQLGVSVRTAEGYVAKVMNIMRHKRESLSVIILLFCMKQ